MIKLGKKKLVWTVAILLPISIVGFLVRAKNRPLPVKTTKAENRDIIKTISVNGKVTAENMVNLSFGTSGRVARMNIAEGEKVKKGQTLASIDVSSLYNAYLSKSALYEKAKVTLNTFVETYRDDPASAAANSEDIYWSKYKELAKSVESAKASLDAASANLSNGYIITPISGTATKVNYSEGEFSTAGSTAIQIADLESLYFEIFVSQEDIGQIKPGQEVSIKLDTYPNERLSGSVYKINESASKDAAGNSVFEVKIRINENPKGNLWLGMEGTADIVLENKLNALSIDSAAIISGKDTDFVYVIDKSKAKKRAIKTDFEGDTYIQIIDGLKQGDIAIISPLEKVSDGKAVIENGN